MHHACMQHRCTPSEASLLQCSSIPKENLPSADAHASHGHAARGGPAKFVRVHCVGCRVQLMTTVRRLLRVYLSRSKNSSHHPLHISIL